MINDKLTLTISDIGNNAEGVAKENGKVIFVPFALPNETVVAQITYEKKEFATAKLTQVLSANKNRVPAPCPYFKICGGCQLQHVSYPESLNLKTQMVKTTLEKIMKQPVSVLPAIGSPTEYRYRNKLAMPVSPKTKTVGMFRELSHNIVPIADCLIQEAWVKNLIACFNEYIKRSGVSVYDESTGKGEIRHLVARSVNNKLLVTVVVNAKTLNRSEILVDLLSQKFAEFGINYNINLNHNNVIMTNQFVPVFGLSEIAMTDSGICYAINNQSFLQVNDEIKDIIYHKVLDEIPSSYTVIDAYSGAGFLTALLSQKAKFVYGIEIVKPATELADKLIAENNIKNVVNINGDCAEELPKLVDKLNAEQLAIVLDPPRKGCDKKVLDAVMQSGAETVLYISCNPATLARDLAILCANNYRFGLVQPLDMFPQTKHIETYVILKKQ